MNIGLRTKDETLMAGIEWLFFRLNHMFNLMAWRQFNKDEILKA